MTELSDHYLNEAVVVEEELLRPSQVEDYNQRNGLEETDISKCALGPKDVQDFWTLVLFL